MLSQSRDLIFELCRKYKVAKLYAFGSAIRDDFQPGKSDIDLLVEFQPMDGYARVEAFFGMLDELETRLGERVDLVMAGAIRNKTIADEVERSKEMIYAA